MLLINICGLFLSIFSTILWYYCNFYDFFWISSCFFMCKVIYNHPISVQVVKYILQCIYIIVDNPDYNSTIVHPNRNWNWLLSFNSGCQLLARIGIWGHFQCHSALVFMPIQFLSTNIFKHSLSDMIIGNRIFDSGGHNRDLFIALLLLSINDLFSCDQARKFTCVWKWLLYVHLVLKENMFSWKHRVSWRSGLVSSICF